MSYNYTQKAYTEVWEDDSKGKGTDAQEELERVPSYPHFKSWVLFGKNSRIRHSTEDTIRNFGLGT